MPTLLRGGDGGEDGEAVDPGFDVGGRAKLVGKHLVYSGYLVLRLDDQTDHGSPVSEEKD